VKLKSWAGKVIVDVVTYGETEEEAKEYCRKALSPEPFVLWKGEGAQTYEWRLSDTFERREDLDIALSDEVQP
jgi:hypothetical protein